MHVKVIVIVERILTISQDLDIKFWYLELIFSRYNVTKSFICTLLSLMVFFIQCFQFLVGHRIMIFRKLSQF